MTNSNSNKRFSRTEFLKVAAVGLVSLAVKACNRVGINIPTTGDKVAATASPTALEMIPGETQKAVENIEPTATPDGRAKVAFVKTGERAAGVRQAIALLGINPVAGKKVFLKPNFNSADPAPGSTHPEVLRAIIESLKEMGAAEITIGDRSGMGDTRGVMEQLGVFALAKETGCQAIVFDELTAADWVIVKDEDSHWKQGFPFAKPALDADVVVQAACLKTHRYGGHFTMSLKNSVGLVAKFLPGNDHNYMNELHVSLSQREKIAEINAAYTPGLIVIDGVEAFTDGGPAEGKKVASNVVLAGTDRIAMDAVGVALLRYYGTTSKVSKGKIFEQDQIARAAALGLGVDGPDKINMVTGDEESAAYAAEIQQILMQG